MLRRHLSIVLTAALSLAVGSAVAQEKKPSRADTYKEGGLVVMMKKAETAMAKNDRMTAGRHLAWVAMMGPAEDPQFKEWKPIGMKAAYAAKKGDAKVVADACNKCHELYKEKYRAKYGGKKPEEVPAQ